MRIDLNRDVHEELAQIRVRLDVILDCLHVQAERGALMSAQLTALAREVAENAEVQASAILLLEGLSSKIEALKNDPVALQALADELNTNSGALAAAVVAHTPVEG